MATALVMGITGGFGGSTAEALRRRGWSIRALLRDPARLPAQFADVEAVTGDAADIQAVRRAADGADLIVYAVNPPGYKWKGVVLPMLENVATVAEERDTTVLFPGNVYVFDPADGPEFNEQAPMRPNTGKGETRKAMELRLRLAVQRGARVIVLRMGDYIGRHAPSAWLGVLVKRTRNGYKVSAPGPRDLPHTWAYLPDAAEVAATLADKRDRLPAWSVFHFRGHRMSLNDVADALRTASGREVVLKSFPWWPVRAMAPFSVLFRGLQEMRYLWDHPVNLDDRRLRRILGGPPPHTPLQQVLAEIGLLDD
jgi:nucleoside-diphosphate-sugar epimerase